ncbi:hypothetical protein [Paenibacillus ginsengarvi]|uniref:Nucleotidyltransferase domain-containing protein n=1 Tax=Paenibacillus ginsengarvi TaxID=400777 RepID=A0A3B0BBK6_9BACL|nr:hypothetical protein [Paenibacillus ginsengarvi]RKN70573.1 hypothetical protein D7M11_30355 [Paenibacillus ginsengarvi]
MEESIQAAAERINLAVRDIMLHHVKSSFRGLIVQGSAVKGGFIAGSSDIDYVLYVDETGLNESGALPIETCINLHQALSEINVHPFRYIQFSVISPKTNKYLPPIPGSYQLLAGQLLEPEATNDQIFQDAVASLNRLQPEAAFHPHQLLDHGEDRIERCARLMCTVVWPVVFQLLTVIHQDGIRIWNLKKQEAVSLLSNEVEVGGMAANFLSSVQSYYPQEQSPEKALRLIEEGFAFLNATKRFWSTHCTRLLFREDTTN